MPYLAKQQKCNKIWLDSTKLFIYHVALHMRLNADEYYTEELHFANYFNFSDSWKFTFLCMYNPPQASVFNCTVENWLVLSNYKMGIGSAIQSILLADCFIIVQPQQNKCKNKKKTTNQKKPNKKAGLRTDRKCCSNKMSRNRIP